VSTPARMGTVIGAQPWFAKGTLEQRQCLRDVVTAAARQCRERRERIKAHPDLADRRGAATSRPRAIPTGCRIGPRSAPS